MTISTSQLGVNAVPPVTTYTIPTTNPANGSTTNAVNIGDLEQEGVILQVSDQGTVSGPQSYNFTAQANDSTYLQLSFVNPVDQASTDYQVLNSQGTVIADSQGTASQQYIFDQLSTSGYALSAGNYTLLVTPPAGSSVPEIAIGALQQQGTSLSVNSTLTAGDPAEYYNFSLGNSNNLKLGFDAGSLGSSARVQILNSSGNVVADNRGTSFEQNAYNQLISGTGLTASAGNYTVAISYASTTSQPDINYNFQLYSGTNYSVVYQTNAAAAPTDTSAAGSVTPATNAQAFGQQAYNTINETAQSAVPVGWLQQNKTAISLTSMLSPIDSTDYFSFVLQGSSSNIKLSLSNLTNASDTNAVHLQLLNSSGGQVIADNQGTAAQKAAFAELASATGLTGTPGDSYVLKATYAQGANKDQNLEYNVKLYSGTTYSSIYNTTASAQTYENAVLSGSLGGGYSPLAAAASYMTSLSSKTAPDIFGITPTFA